MLSGLEFQHQRLHQNDIGLLQEFEDIHFFRIERVLEATRHIGDLAHNKSNRKIWRRRSATRASGCARRDLEAVIVHGAAIDEGGQ